MSYIKKKYILKYTNDGVNWIYTNPPQYKYIWSDDTYIWDGEETICGSVLCSEIPSITINRVQGDWIREGNTFTSNDIDNSQTTIERIYFSVSTPTAITFTIDQSSEKNYDYLVISNLDAEVVSGKPDSIGSSYNYYNHKGKTTGTTSMTISNTEEHFVELMYIKDTNQSSGTDNVIVTLSIPNSCTYDITSEYEVWRNVCNDNVEYRNPKKSYKCDYVTYQWREDENNVCGNALPENTTEVNKAPELNTDFE